MENLYRNDPTCAGRLQPVRGFTECAAVTAMCLMDALCDFEHSAGHRRGLREAGGGVSKPNPAADLGDLLCELRSEQGSFDLRQSVLDMVATVDAAWERVDVDDAAGGHIFFDFEFCPLAVRLRFERGLTGTDLEQALVDAGRDMIDASEAHWAAEQVRASEAAAREARLMEARQEFDRAQEALAVATDRLLTATRAAA